jgi:hypothetical protein
MTYEWLAEGESAWYLYDTSSKMVTASIRKTGAFDLGIFMVGAGTFATDLMITTQPSMIGVVGFIELDAAKKHAEALAHGSLK